MRTFDKTTLKHVSELLPLAEELCGDFFQLSAFDVHSAPYDVVTARDLIAEGVEPPGRPSQLAEVRRCDLTREERSARDRRRIHYRICLWDPHILAVCDTGILPRALLLYLLIHELVHVVRFYRRLALFDATAQARQREEQAVHLATDQILLKAREPGLKQLLDNIPQLGSCLVESGSR